VLGAFVLAQQAAKGATDPIQPQSRTATWGGRSCQRITLGPWPISSLRRKNWRASRRSWPG